MTRPLSPTACAHQIVEYPMAEPSSNTVRAWIMGASCCKMRATAGPTMGMLCSAGVVLHFGQHGVALGQHGVEVVIDRARGGEVVMPPTGVGCLFVLVLVLSHALPFH